MNQGIAANFVAETDAIRERALGRLDELCRFLLPGGHKEGCRWVAGSAQGESGRSFSVNLNTAVFGDWAESSTMRQGAISLWMAARDESFLNARAHLAAWLGMAPGQVQASRPVPSRPKEAKPKKGAWFPRGLERPTPSDLGQLSRTRSIDPTPLRIAADRGHLWCFDDPLNGRCWLYTDQRRGCGLRRRLDNQGFILRNGLSVKAAACPGSNMAAPLGIEEAAAYPCVGIVEGGPNGLAVIAQAWAFGVEAQVAPVVMPCANSRFFDADLKALRGKCCRIFADNDGPGWEAAIRWHGQLREVGITVDGYSFQGLVRNDGAFVKDLNDFCQLDCGSLESHHDAVEAVMAFAAEGGAN